MPTMLWFYDLRLYLRRAGSQFWLWRLRQKGVLGTLAFSVSSILPHPKRCHIFSESPLITSTLVESFLRILYVSSLLYLQMKFDLAAFVPKCPSYAFMALLWCPSLFSFLVCPLGLWPVCTLTDAGWKMNMCLVISMKDVGPCVTR